MAVSVPILWPRKFFKNLFIDIWINTFSKYEIRYSDIIRHVDKFGSASVIVLQ